MPVVSMQEILKPAFEQRYGVAAINIVDDVTMQGVLDGAAAENSPIIIQVSVKTVKFWSAQLLKDMFTEMASRCPIPATLHLDHCPERSVITDCFKAGWNSVLFDGSKLTYEECMEQTAEVVQEAKAYGVAVEGELEAVKGVEDGVGSDYATPTVDLDKALAFVRQTGIDSFAAGIGTAHGLYKGKPEINFQRVSEIVAEEPVPLVLHGGTGLDEPTFKELIRRGEAKVNISTMLKITMADSYRAYLEEKPTEYNPLNLLGHVRGDIAQMTRNLIGIFGSADRGLERSAS